MRLVAQLYRVEPPAAFRVVFGTASDVVAYVVLVICGLPLSPAILAVIIIELVLVCNVVW